MAETQDDVLSTAHEGQKRTGGGRWDSTDEVLILLDAMAVVVGDAAMPAKGWPKYILYDMLHKEFEKKAGKKGFVARGQHDIIAKWKSVVKCYKKRDNGDLTAQKTVVFQKFRNLNLADVFGIKPVKSLEGRTPVPQTKARVQPNASNKTQSKGETVDELFVEDVSDVVSETASQVSETGAISDVSDEVVYRVQSTAKKAWNRKRREEAEKQAFQERLFEMQAEKQAFQERLFEMQAKIQERRLAAEDEMAERDRKFRIEMAERDRDFKLEIMKMKLEMEMKREERMMEMMMRLQQKSCDCNRKKTIPENEPGNGDQSSHIDWEMR